MARWGCPLWDRSENTHFRVCRWEVCNLVLALWQQPPLVRERGAQPWPSVGPWGSWAPGALEDALLRSPRPHGLLIYDAALPFVSLNIDVPVTSRSMTETVFPDSARSPHPGCSCLASGLPTSPRGQRGFRLVGPGQGLV